jgi:hypothetical protein
MMIKKFGQGG